jgi:hypothetical protein
MVYPLITGENMSIKQAIDTLIGYASRVSLWASGGYAAALHTHPWKVRAANAATNAEMSAAASTADVQLLNSQMAAVVAAHPPTVTSVSLGDTAVNAYASVNVSSLSTRYSNTVNGDGTVTIAQTLGAIMSIGVRSQLQASAGVTLSASCGFTSGFSSTHSGVQIGFDPTGGVGTYQSYGAGNVFITWRASGSLVAYTYAADGSVAESAASGYTISNASPPTFASTDTVSMTVTVSAAGLSSGGTIKCYKNGVLSHTATINTLPSSYYFVGAIRSGGAQTATLKTMSLSAPLSVPSASVVTGVLANVKTLMSRRPAAALSHAGYTDVSNRSVPAAMAGLLPIVPVGVRGPGCVEISATPLGAFWAANGASVSAGQCAWVDAAGNDGTGAVGNPALPYLTIQAALNSAATLVLVGNGTFAPFKYRQDLYPALGPKIVAAKNRHGATIAVTGGDDISASTWAATSGQSGVYQTTISTPLGGVDKVLRNDMLDERGFSARLPKRYSLSALQSAAYGWYYASGVLYVALRGANLASVGAPALQACYLDANGDSRIYVCGKELLIVGFQTRNIQYYADEYVSSGVGTKARIWEEDCINFMSPTNGHMHYAVGSDIITMARNHASAADAHNLNPGSLGYAGLCLELPGYTTDSGDLATYGTTNSDGSRRYPNLNGSSCHGGLVARFGHVYEGAYGPEIADTTPPSMAVSNVSWNVACIAANPSAVGGNTPTYGFGAYGIGSASAANRKMYSDTCLAVGYTGAGVYASGGGAAYTYSTESTPAAAAADSLSSVSEYSPAGSI